MINALEKHLESLDPDTRRQLDDDPLHPEKPEPPIVAGYVWQKIASGKTSVNAPRIQVQRTINGRIRRIAVRQVFPLPGPEYTMTERVFRRDWRPC